MKLNLLCLICGEKRGGVFGVDHRKCSIKMQKISNSMRKKKKTVVSPFDSKVIEYFAKTNEF